MKALYNSGVLKIKTSLLCFSNCGNEPRSAKTTKVQLKHDCFKC